MIVKHLVVRVNKISEGRWHKRLIVESGVCRIILLKVFPIVLRVTVENSINELLGLWTKKMSELL